MFALTPSTRVVHRCPWVGVITGSKALLVCACVHVCILCSMCMCVHTCPVIVATSSISPGLAVISWYAILRADFLVLINTSPLATLNAIYYRK